MTGQRLTTSLKKIEWIDANCSLAVTPVVFIERFCLAMRKFLQLNRQKDRVYAHISKEVQEVIGRVERDYQPSSVMVWKSLGFPAGFRYSSQGRLNSAVTAKEHCSVHICLGLALRKP
ncbi:unnamed protein product [Nezara viridula]|uniref:Uncharacterized protein n=1 Tax=Nezara viridula TaxID=85310 RepID=A0A9P0E6P9_NEZVI|nr:unnamed protein product [Nezara viridula]